MNFFFLHNCLYFRNVTREARDIVDIAKDICATKLQKKSSKAVMQKLMKKVVNATVLN